MKLFKTAHSHSLVKITLFITLMFVILTFSSCIPGGQIDEELVFNGDLAYQLIVEQVSFGARYSGSPGHEKVQELIIETLENNNWDVESYNNAKPGLAANTHNKDVAVAG